MVNTFIKDTSMFAFCRLQKRIFVVIGSKYEVFK